MKTKPTTTVDYETISCLRAAANELLCTSALLQYAPEGNAAGVEIEKIQALLLRARTRLNATVRKLGQGEFE